MVVRALLLVLVAMLESAPAAAAGAEDDDYASRIDLCIIAYRPSEDFSLIHVDADQEMSAEELAGLSAEVDTDDDGNITAAEVDAYEQGSVRTGRDLAEGPHGILLDDDQPRTTEFLTRLHGFEGPVDEERPRLVTEERTFGFDVEEASSHRLEGGLYELVPRAVIEFVIVEAPDGWVVHAVNGTVFDAASVELPRFDTQEPYSMEFARADPERKPGLIIPGPPGLLVVGAALLLLSRRRGA